MRAIAELILKELVSDYDQVKIDELIEGDRIRLTVTVADGDIGRVIGRQGRTISAIRTVIKAAAIKRQLHVTFDLVTPDGATDDSNDEALVEA
jgi:uncharacterized protein